MVLIPDLLHTMKIESTVIIPHSSSVDTLVSLLIQLQSQTLLPKCIYIIDCSNNKSGLQKAKKFAFNNVPIIVEVAKGTIYENWNRGIDLSQTDYPNASMFIVNDDILVPQNTIERLVEVDSLYRPLALVPKTPPRTHLSDHITTIFKTISEKKLPITSDWLCGFAFYLTAECVKKVGIFDTSYKVWFGDTDYEQRIIKKAEELKRKSIGLIEDLYVYHYGGSSYKYYSKEVLDLIDKDRELYLSKYKTLPPNV